MKKPASKNEVSHDHEDHPNPVEVFDNSTLLCQLAEKMSSCEHAAIASLAMALGRMCQVHNIPTEEAYELVVDAEIVQSDLDNETELEAIEEELKKEEPKN